MANEFKIKKGLIVTGADGGTVVDIQGSQGQLFSVTDDLSGSIFAVSDISGVPILDVNSSGLSTFAGNVDIDGGTLNVGSSNQVNIVASGFSLFPSLKVNNNGYLGSASVPTQIQLLSSGNTIFAKDLLLRGTYNPYAQANRGNITLNGSNTNIIAFTNNTVAKGYIYHNGTDLEILNVGTGILKFATSNAERMRITSSGNVGIGTTSPVSLLHIKGADPVFTIQDTSTGTAQASSTLRLGESGSGGVLDVYWDIKQASDIFNTHLEINHSSNGNHLTILDNGNVGIGTTNPGNKLVIQTPFTTSASNSYIEINSGHEASGGGDVSGATGILFKQAGSGNVLRWAGSIISGRESNYSTDSLADSYLAFFTAANNVNTERMRITSAGNVGIGTTSPGTKLYVDGGESTFNRGNSAGTIATFRGQNAVKAVIGTATSYFTGNVGIGTTSPQQKLHIVDTDGANIILNSNTGAENNGIWMTEGGIASPYANGAYVHYDSTNNAFKINTGTTSLTTKLTIERDSGNVGIGATSPGARLEVSDDTTGIGAIVGNTTHNSRLQIYTAAVSKNSEIWFGDAADSDIGKIDYDHANNSMAFTTNAGERMRITSAGNVGIGTTLPRYQLDLAKPQDSSQADYIGLGVRNGPSGGAGTGLGSGLIWKANYTGYTKRSAGIVQIAEGHFFRSGLAFYTNGTANATTDWSERMRIDSSGNVGIGTTSPIDKLNVNGGTGDTSTQDSKLALTRTSSTGNVLAGKMVLKHKATNYGNLVFQVKTTASSAENSAYYTDAITIDGQNANVGIGTTTPNAKLDIQGTQGQLFSVTDDLSGDIFSVADISGVPIMNVNSDGTSYFDGNVGIGTTSPDAKVEISQASSGLQYEALRLTNTADSGNMGAYISWHDSYAVDQMQLVSQRDGAGNGSIFTFNQRISGVSSPALVLKNGNVGIGTTSPGAKLDVNGDVFTRGTEFIFQSANNTTGYLYFDHSGTQVWKQGIFSDNTSTFSIGTGGEFSRLFNITNAGNVGIGTTSPGNKLSVVTAIGGDDVLPALGANGGKFSLLNNGGLYGLLQGVTGSGSSFIQSQRVDATATAYSLLLNPNGGNVGIGTTSPGAKLEINDGSTQTELRISVTGDTGYSTINFSDASDINPGQIYYHHQQNLMNFRTNDNDRMVINSSGNVGIGATSPSKKLHLSSTSNNGSDILQQTDGSRIILLEQKNGSIHWQLGTFGSTGGGANNRYSIKNATTGVEALVVHPISSNIGIGNTSPDNKLDVVGISRFTHSSSVSYRGAIETVVDNAYPTWSIGWLHARTSSSTYGNIARFNNQTGSSIGGINYNGASGTSFVTTSDYRLKENIKEISDSISRVKKLKPCRFNFAAEKNRVIDGFIAHEVQEVVPEAVHGEKDALQEDGSINAQTLEVSRLIPVLTKALQEAIDKIEELELRIQTLENK